MGTSLTLNHSRVKFVFVLTSLSLLVISFLVFSPPGSAARKTASISGAVSNSTGKLYWGSDENYNPGNFVTGFTRAGNQGKIDETTMTNQGESAPPDPYGRHMRASGWWTVLGDGEYTWVTNERVNLTGIDTIKIMWRQTWDDPGIWRLVVSNVKNSSYNSDVIKMIHHESKISPYAVESLDVSDLTGEYYIRVHARRNSGIGDRASTTRVYKLWLEPPVRYLISTSSNPSVGGSTSGWDYYVAGSTATVSATPAPGYEFVSWTENGSIVSMNPTYSFTVTGARNLVANFRLSEKRVYWDGTEYFSINSGYKELVGVTREKRSDHLYLKAEFAASGVQVAWSTDEPIDLTGINQIAVQWKNTGVDHDDNESYIVAATNNYDKQEDQTKKLRRTKNFGLRVDRLDVSDINEPRYIRIHARDAAWEWPRKSEIYVYKIWLEPPIRCEITTQANPPAGGTTEGGGFYTYGSLATVTATPSSNYEFINWTESGVVVSTNASYTFTVTNDRNLVANFLPRFRVTSITPDFGVENTVVQITDLSGAGFEPGASVRIENASKTVYATSVVVVSPNKITCSLNLSGAPLGKYDVVVRNPDATEARLTQGFRVTNICGGGAAISLSFFGLVVGLLAVAGSFGARARRKR